MSEERPLVSVICVSYNQEKYVLDCLESIKQQNYPNMELIVADDCSRDGTFNIISEWCIENKSIFCNMIYYSNNNNIGVCNNCNEALKKSHGKYIKMLAMDDILLPNAINHIVYYLENNACDVAYTNAIVIGPDDSLPVDIANKKTFYDDLEPLYGAGQDLFDAMYLNNFLCSPTIVFRKKTLLKYGLYSDEYGFEDWEYWLRLLSNGGSIGYLDKITVGYRVLPNSASHFTGGIEEERRYEEYLRKMISLLNYYGFYTHVTKDKFYLSALSLILKNSYFNLLKSLYVKEKRDMGYLTKLRYWLALLVVKCRRHENVVEI